MRLPIETKNQTNVNEAEAIKLIRYADDQGVNYSDYAYVYHEGNMSIIDLFFNEGLQLKKLCVILWMLNYLENEDKKKFHYMPQSMVKTS